MTDELKNQVRSMHDLAIATTELRGEIKLLRSEMRDYAGLRADVETLKQKVYLISGVTAVAVSVAIALIGRYA